MARTKPQEIIRRTHVASRTTDAPDLVVAADLDSARGYQGLSRAAISTLGRVQSVMTTKAIDDRAQRWQADTEAGAAARQQEFLSGGERQAADALAEQTEQWRMGYYKTDGILRIRDWQVNAAKRLAQAEPGSNVDEMLQAELAELMERPEFQNPKVRQALMPAIDAAAVSVRQTAQKAEVAELFERQHEGLTELARVGVVDGSLRTADGLKAFYENLNTEQFAFLNHDDVNAILADAFGTALSSGDVDIPATMEFLSKPLPGTDKTLLTGKYREALTKAASAGQAVIEEKVDHARGVAEAKAEFTLQGMAENAQLTDRAIDEAARSIGYSPEETPSEYLSFVRRWTSAQDTAVRRMEAEREKREREAEKNKNILAGNFYAVSDTDLKKHLTKRWTGAKTPEAQLAVLKQGAQWNIPVEPIVHMMERSTPGTPEWDRSVQLFSKLKDMNEVYAYGLLSEKRAGMLTQYDRDVNDLGIDPKVAAKALVVNPDEAADSKAVISSTWEEGIEPWLETESGHTRGADELRYIRLMAERIQATTGVDGAAAIRAAVGKTDTRYTVVNGVRTLNTGMPRGAEPHIEAFVSDLQPRLVKAGVIEEGDELSAMPNPERPGEWVVVGPDGFMVDDPAGGSIAFNAREIASARVAYDDAMAVLDARKEQAFRRFKPGANVVPLGKTRVEMYDEWMANVPSRIKAEQEALAGLNPASSAYKIKVRQIDALKRKRAELVELSSGIPDVPKDFLKFAQQYITQHRSR